MKTTTFKKSEEKIGDNSLPVKPGLSALNSLRIGIHNITENKIFNSFPQTETLSKMKFFYTTPALSNHREPNKGGFTNKNSFMKTFLQKTVVIAITIIANLFLVNNVVGQTTVFTENFNRASLTTGAPTTYTVTNNGTGSTSTISGSAFLQITGTTSTFTSNQSYVTGLLSSYIAPYATTLASNTGLITWTFNMRYARTTAPSGFSTGSYGIATVLAATGANLTTANGYAIVYGGTDATQRYKLVSFAGGLNSNTKVTNIIASTSAVPTAVNDFISIRVTYDPVTNNWAMYLRDDGASAWADPSTGVTTQMGATTVNNTFTASAMTSFGFLWNYGTSSSTQFAQFDNFAASVCSYPAQPSVITGPASSCANLSQTYSVTNVAGVTYTWTLPTGWIQTAGGTTNSITVTTGSASGNISVTPSNTCGNGVPRTLAVTTTPNLSLVAISTGTAESICSTGSGSLVTAAETGGGIITSRQWGIRSTSGGSISNIGGASGQTYTPLGSDFGIGTWLLVCTSTPTCGSAVVSNEITVTVNADLSAVNITPTASQSFCSDITGSLLTVSEINGGTIASRQWGKRSVSLGTITPISGAVTASFTPTLANLGEGTWLVVCTSTPQCGAPITSNEVSVTVSAAPSISSQPTNQSACLNGSATFTIGATATGISYQWFKGSTPLSDVGNITGSQTATLNINPAGAGDAANNYSCLVTSSACTSTATSNNATLTINPLPTLTGATQSAGCNGSGALITLTGLLANSTSTINYTINGVAQTAMTGVTADNSGTASFMSRILSMADNSQTLEITGVTVNSATPNCSGSFAQDILLVVNPLPGVFTLSGGTTICTGSSANITVSNSETGVNYQLRNNSGNALVGSAVSGNGSSIIIPTGPLTSTTTFNVLATNATTTCNAQMSGTVQINVDQVPVAAFSASATSVNTGATINFTDLTTNNPTSWAWSFPGGVPPSTTTQNVSVVYNTPGTFDVSLTASNTCTSAPLTKTAFITITSLANPITFTTSGSFTVPPGVTCVKAEAWGGGGAGGGANRTGGGGTVNGGGGAGGAYASSFLTVSPGAIPFTVGGQTTPTVTSTAAANTGSPSWFGSTTTVFAQGGPGGGPASNGTGTAGTGSSALSIGTTVTAGGNGGAGNTGGTGSVGGTGANGGGTGGAGLTGNGTGNPGNPPGGGGSGARTTASNTLIGGIGAIGRVRVTWVDASDFHVTATTPICATGNSTVTITSTSLAAGSYTVSYTTTVEGPNTATMSFSGGTGNFQTVTLSGASSTLTVTAITFAGWTCSSPITQNNTAAIVITPLPPTPTISAGGTTAICVGQGGSVTLTSSATDGNQWLLGGTPISGATNQTFNATAAGSYTVVATANLCASVTSDPIVVTSNIPTIATTGTATTVCFNAGDQNTSIAYSATTNNPTSYSIVWNGITPQASTPFAFSASGGTINNIDIPAGTAGGPYTGTMTIMNDAGCTSTQNVSMTIIALPTANAGNDVVTCANNGVGLADGATVGSSAGILWTQSGGAGTIGNPTSLTGAFYTPDITEGNITTAKIITLTLTVTPVAPCTTPVVVTKSLTLQPIPIVIAGANQIACATPGPIPFASGASALRTASIQWSTLDGGGSIDQGNSITGATYTPTANEISNQSTIHFTLTGFGVSPCVNVTSQMTVTIGNHLAVTIDGAPMNACSGFQPIITANATGGKPFGSDYIYQWFLNGSPIDEATDQSFTPESPLTTGVYTYTVSVTDQCSTALSNNKIITITDAPSIATQPSDATVCANDPLTLTTTVAGGAGTKTFVWFKNGSNNSNSGGTQVATSSSSDPLVTTSTFNPPTSIAGTTYYYMTYSADGSNCGSVTTNAIAVTVNPIQTANASSASATICQGSNVALTGVIGGAATSATWDDGGVGGTFTPSATALSVTWAPPSSFTGTATLTLTTGTGLCPQATATVTENVNANCQVIILTQPDPLAANALQNSGVTCFGTNTGSATVSVTGGTINYSFLWDDGETTATATQLSGGSHTVTVTDSHNCQTTAIVSIDAPTAAVAASVASTDASCFGTNNGTITISSPVGGYGTYEYSIDGGATWQANGGNYTGLAGATYNVEIRDASQITCATPLNASLLINQPTAAVSASLASSDVTCFGAANGTITISSPVGGFGTYQYSIDGGTSWQDNGGNYTGLSGGTYNVQIRDASQTSCATTLNAALVVKEPTAAVNATLASSNVTCFGANDGTITLTSPVGGYGGYQYSIDGGQNWQFSGSFTGLSGSTYNVQIRDAAEPVCVTTINATLLINAPTAAVNASVASTDVSCFGANNGTITISSPVGGYGTYEYSVDGGATWQANGGNYTGLADGTYNVEIRDASQITCATPLNAALVIHAPTAAVNASLASSDVTCFGAANGTITISSPVGGFGTYQYSIDGGSSWQDNGGNYTGLSGGTYNVQIRDASQTSCATTLNAALVVKEPTAAVNATLASSNVTCFGANDGTITLTSPVGGYGGYQYSIDGGQNWQFSGSFTGLSGSTYNVQIRDAAEPVCVTTINATLLINAPTAAVNASVASTDVSCFGANNGTITISSPVGGYGTYEYSVDGGATWQANGGNYTGLADGTYNVEIRDASQITCATPLNAALVIHAPTAAVSATLASSDVTCFGANNGTITISSPVGGFGTYQYSIDGGATWQSNGGNYTGLAGGTYNVEIRDASQIACATPLNAALVIHAPTAAVNASLASTDVSCFGANNGTITISSPVGGYGTYEYSIDGGATWQSNGGTYNGLTGGTYNVEIRDASQITCATPLNAALVIHAPTSALSATATGTNIVCNGTNSGSASVSVTGGTTGYTYLWSPGGATTSSISSLAVGLYTVTVTDAHGCTTTSSYNVTQAPPLLANYTPTNVSCFGANDGKIEVDITGGAFPYLYSIDGNTAVGGNTNSSMTFTGLVPGGHTIVVTDANLCSTSGTFTITQPAQLAAVASAGTVSCSNSTTSLFVIATGGTAPYMYSLNGGSPQSGFVFTVGAGGPYIVTVTDAHSCTVNTASVSVAGQSQMTINFSAVTPSGCSGPTGSFTVTASGGAGSYMYSLNGGGLQTNGSFTGLAATSYLVTAQDGNGCTVSGIVTIPSVTPLTVYSVTGGGSSCNGGSFAIGLNGSQSGVTYSLVLNNATVVQSLIPVIPGLGFSFNNQSEAGNYTVIASNALTGCLANMSGSANITTGTPPTAFTVTGGGNYCNGAGPVIGLSGSQSGVSYQLVVDGTNTGAPINGNNSTISFGNQTTIGTYTVVATNAAGCTNNMSNSVGITGGSLPTPFAVTADPDNCTGLGVHIKLAASQVNVTYQLILNGSIDGAVAPVAGGNGTPIDFGPQPSGTYTVTATSSAGCTANMTGSVTVVSSSLPIAYSVTGGGNYCSGGLGIHVGLQNSESGVNYQLFNGATAVSGFFPGSTGSQIDFGLFQAGTYTAVAKNATGCTNNMTGSVTVSLTPAPATVTLIAPNGVNDCTGTGADIQISGSETGVDYQLSVNGIAMGALIPGTGGQIDLGKKPSGTYTIVGTSHTGGCVGNTSNSITVNSGTAPIAYTVTGGGNYCSGPGIAIGLLNSETGVNYVLMLNGTTNVGFATGTTGNSLSFGNYTANGTYSVVATNSITNCTATMSNSVSINAGSAPTAFNVTGTGIYCNGGTGLRVGLSGSENGINYQLMLNGSPSGAALVGNGIALDFGFQTAGTYTVVATNTQAGCTSNMTGSANISVNNAAVIINTQPLTQSFCGSVQLSVSATGATGYQWFLGETSIGGANAATYTATASGSYTVVVSGICGAPVTSNPAVLTTPVPVSITTQPQSQTFTGSNVLSVVASNATGYQWYLGGNPITGANSPSYTATAAGTYKVIVSGMCSSQATSSDAVLSACPAVTINTQPLTQSFCGSVQLSVSASNATGYQWQKGGNNITGANSQTYTATSAGSYTVVVSGNCGSPVTSNPAVLTTPAPVSITAQPQSQTFTGSNVLSVVASNATGYQWYLGGNPITGANSPSYTATAAGTYKVVVSGMCSSQVTSANAVLSTCPAVTINTQPLTQSFCGSVQLSVSASNATGYQWKKGSNNIIGANSQTYTATSAGSYTVVVSGNCGSPVTSNPAVLTVTPGVTINTQPQSQSFCGSVQLSVSASNASGYQWKNGGNNISGANNSTYTATTAGTYTVVVSALCGSSVTSNPAVLTANASVAITTQPVNKSICSGGSATFSVVASNASGYQWFRGNNSISGANSPSYTTGIAGNYKVVVSGGCGSPVTSNTVTLSVGAGVTIVTQPVSTQICAGGTESFSVVATGATGYQWYRNSNLIIGATNSQYFTGTTGRYDCRVFDACGGSVMSDFAMLTINSPVAITSQPQSVTVCSDGTGTFTVVASNANGYQWYRGNSAIPTATHASYTTPVAGNYKVVVTGGCGGPITSNTVTLSFLSPPSVAAINGTGTTCTGTQVRFTDATSGGTWSSSNTNIATVSATGFVRGVSGGTATIRYTISNGCSTNTATRNITVNDVPAVQDITGNSSVCPGSNLQLSDGTPNGDWSSSNNSVATVNNNGRVRGIRNGNVTISYTVQNSCGMTTVSIPIAVSCGGVQKNSLGTITNSDDQLTLNVSVSPNPSQNFFTLIAQSSVLDVPLTISIFDMQNRLVDKHTAGVGEAVRFGDRFAAGMYIVQVTQGGLQKTVKVVKN